MDIGVFDILKNAWQQKAVNFRITHEGKQMQKHNFPPVLKSTLDCLIPARIVKAFNACRLVP